MIYKVNGVKIKLTEPDLDGDGVRGDIEVLERQGFRDMGQTEILQNSDTKESMKELNEDVIDKDTNLSSIDMKSRLNIFDLSSIVAIDSLVALKVYPSNVLMITRSRKRNSVSINGLGRQEQVQIATGIREHNEMVGSSMWDKIKNSIK